MKNSIPNVRLVNSSFFCTWRTFIRYLEFYVQSSHRHFQYQHESHSISSQPSSTSDVDEASSSLHKMVCEFFSFTRNSSGDSFRINQYRIKSLRKRNKRKRNVKILMNLKSKTSIVRETDLYHRYFSRRPVSPYALFFRDTQNDIKKKLANPSFGWVKSNCLSSHMKSLMSREISKVVAHMWESIDPEVKEVNHANSFFHWLTQLFIF